MKKFLPLVCSLFLILSFVPAASSQEKVDLETITRIRYEGFRNSKVMDLASGLMDSIGERLTGSPNMRRANEWTRDKLTEMGMSNSHLEPWGPIRPRMGESIRECPHDDARHRASPRLCQGM